jgi:dihydroorotate dehydrogenase
VTRIGEGGLSGKPLRERSTRMIAYLHQKLGPDFPIIGAGGIHSPQDALEKLKAGATLIEIYTGFIYEGPGLVKKINKYLVSS